MNELQRHQEICRDFADLLSYPGNRVKEQAIACAAHIQEVSPEAATSLDSFLCFIKENGFSRIEEAFTGTFDLQSLCHPYVGYQLCGESQQRTMFMIKLRELYKQYDFTPGNELPDHLTEIMRFLGSIADQECRQEIIQDGLLPALEKITQGIESDNQPYVGLLNALQSFLSGTVTPDNEELQDDRQKECLS